MNRQLLKNVPLRDVQINDSFWNHYIDLVGDVILPFMRDSSMIVYKMQRRAGVYRI